MTGNSSLARKPLCDGVTVRLNDLAQYRRFWRPTIKFLLSGTNLSSLITGLLFYSLISYVMLQRLTFSNMVIPITLLIGMELASDMSDSILSETLTDLLSPCEIIFNLAATSLLVFLEIVLWQSVVRFYQNYLQDLQ